MTPPGGARAVALAALLTIERQRTFADETLDRLAGPAGLDARDRALAVELVYGVLRHQATLDWRLAQVSDQPIDRLPLNVRAALRLAAYQLLYLDRIPASAAVNESVALVKAGPPGEKGPARKWDGFTNAVLRTLLRKPAPPPVNRDDDPVGALSVHYSCPSWLVERWIARYGLDQAALVCEATLRIPPLTIRANRLRVTRDALMEELRGHGLTVVPTEVSPSGLRLDKCGPVTDIPSFKEGRFYIEDEAAQMVATILDPQPGESVLDACAAPGGKTTHLAALMRNQGEIVALDQNARRLALLEENCRRLGIGIVSPLAGDAVEVATLVPGRQFDRILLDAPCSGLGILRRHPEGKWQKDAARFPLHQQRQRRLLDAVSRLLRPGGCLVYSTCSTEPEENEQVIDHFCSQHADFHREPVAAWLPSTGQALVNAQGDFSSVFNPFSMDGFFAARLRKGQG